MMISNQRERERRKESNQALTQQEVRNEEEKRRGKEEIIFQFLCYEDEQTRERNKKANLRTTEDND